MPKIYIYYKRENIMFPFSQKFKIWLTIIKYSQIYYNKNITKLQNRYFFL